MIFQSPHVTDLEFFVDDYLEAMADDRRGRAMARAKSAQESEGMTDEEIQSAVEFANSPDVQSIQGTGRNSAGAQAQSSKGRGDADFARQQHHGVSKLKDGRAKLHQYVRSPEGKTGPGG
jgi:hypothetical protein